MRTYNKVILMGNFARDPDLKTFDGGKQCVNFTIATNRKWTGPEGQDSEEVSFIDCQSWGGQAKTIADYFTKGRPIFIEGRLKQDTWEKEGKKHSRLRVIVESFNFIDNKKSTEAIPSVAGNDTGTLTGDMDFDSL